MTWQVVKPRLPTLIQPAIDWVVPIGEPSLPTAIIRRGGLRLSSMRVPLCVCGIGFGAELRPGLFIGFGASVFGEVEVVHVQFEVNTLHYRGAWH